MVTSRTSPLLAVSYATRAAACWNRAGGKSRGCIEKAAGSAGQSQYVLEVNACHYGKFDPSDGSCTIGYFAVQWLSSFHGVQLPFLAITGPRLALRRRTLTSPLIAWSGPSS